MNNNMSNQPPITPCISSKEMLDYTQGILSPKEQHRIEKHLLDCEFCADAMEGIELMKNPNELLEVERELNFDIDTKISGEEDEENKVKVLFPWRIAAAVVLIFVSALTLWMVLPKTNVQELALENSKPYPAPTNVASEPILEITEMQVLDEQSAAPLSKSSAPPVASKDIQINDAVAESAPTEKKLQADEVFSNQAPVTAHIAKEESEKKASNDLANTTNEETTTATKATSETVLTGVEESSKRPPARATSSSGVQRDAVVAEEITDDNKINSEDFFKKGIKEYKNKKYAVAISYLEKCMDKPEARFYSGVSYFLLENPHLAISNLEKYIQTNQATYREASYWYLGLSYLKLENKAAAKQAFEKVLPFKGEFEKQALEMLKSL